MNVPLNKGDEQSMMNLKEQALIDIICTEWHSAAEQLDSYYREGLPDLAFATNLSFSGWLSGFASVAYYAGMKEAHELACFAECLWRNRTRIRGERHAKNL